MLIEMTRPPISALRQPSLHAQAYIDSFHDDNAKATLSVHSTLPSLSARR